VATPPAAKARPKSWLRDYGPLALAVLVNLLLVTIILYYWKHLQELAVYGYAGTFILSILSGTTIIPSPNLPVIIALGGVLNPLLVGSVAGLGEAVGGTTAYLTGAGGKMVLQSKYKAHYERLTRWMLHRGSTVVFLTSSLFFPLFYPTALVAGMLRFRLWRFFLISLAGRIMKGIFFASIGYFGLSHFLHL